MKFEVLEDEGPIFTKEEIEEFVKKNKGNIVEIIKKQHDECIDIISKHSEEVEEKVRTLIVKCIWEGVKKIATFKPTDGSPRVLLNDGHLEFIIDGYLRFVHGMLLKFGDEKKIAPMLTTIMKNLKLSVVSQYVAQVDPRMTDDEIIVTKVSSYTTH